MSTIFTKIINKEIYSDIIYEDDHAIAFNDISPQSPTHFLIIPKKEIKTLNDISDNDKELIGHLFVVAKKLALKLGFDEDGYRIVFNCNEHAGQTVFHIHMHVLAGRKLTWPPG